jgi:simple sugar transport system permease protein
MHSVSLVLISGVLLSAPLLYAAMGELISEVAGVINIELEGMMLCGAFAGVMGTSLTGNLGVGFLAAAVGGMAVAAVHGLTSLVFGANQVVSGVVLNILALGVTSYLLSAWLAPRGGTSVATLSLISIPGLSHVPVIGQALFDQNLMVYVAYLTVPVVWWALNRTALGLILKAAGERPATAESLGVDVQRTRWLALLACGLLAGIGGGQLTLAALGIFTQNMTAGRGFIALAAVVFGRWHAFGVAAAVLIFATADALQIRAQALGIGIPYQFLVMLPYLVTLVALAGLFRPMRPPSSLGVNYEQS